MRRKHRQFIRFLSSSLPSLPSLPPLPSLLLRILARFGFGLLLCGGSLLWGVDEGLTQEMPGDSIQCDDPNFPPRPVGRIGGSLATQGDPYLVTNHRVNKLGLAVTNSGTFSAVASDGFAVDAIHGGGLQRSCEYPRRSNRDYLDNMDIWVGARVNREYAVSTGHSGYYGAVYQKKFLPVNLPGSIEARSTVELYGGPHPDAVSEEDFICEYSDSIMRGSYYQGYELVPNDQPLGILVKQKTHAWSNAFAEDFVIVDLLVENVGSQFLRDVYVGVHVTPQGRYGNASACVDDGEVAGLLPTYPSTFGCGFEDSLDLAWHANNDGDAYEGEWIGRPKMVRPDGANHFCGWASSRDALGIVPLRAPSPSMNYNWWTTVSTDVGWYQMEPSKAGSVPTAVPFYWNWYSTNQYYRLLSTRERDYPTYWTSAVASNYSPEGWQRPPQHVAYPVSSNTNPDVLLSWGPVSLPRGHQIKLSFAVVAGRNIHTNPGNLRHLPLWPDWYERYLDFTDLAQNALRAKWVFDNPGVDTDGDGYAGEFRVCVRDSVLVNGVWVAQQADTQWYAGDGMPDFRAAYPPVGPKFWLTPIHNGVRVRFNGEETETKRDVFLQRPDWEGYRVYLGRDDREENLTVVAGCDQVNFDKWVLNNSGPEPVWDLEGEPFTLAELRCLYGAGADPCIDSSFDPLHYDNYNRYYHPQYPQDSVFRFEAHGYNQEAGRPSVSIRKRFPEVPDPRLLPAESVTAEMYTEDGHLKFFEYECEITELLPSVGYYVTVTAYDFGSPASGLYPMESEKGEGITLAYPLTAWDDEAVDGGKIYVYPNPYRVDVSWREAGIEGRENEDRWDERLRDIWFANLPPKCTIHIYTIDGDRVRTLNHDMSPSDPAHKRHRWGLINRNQQLVQTGLYYWVVEIPGEETQMGKLVILR